MRRLFVDRSLERGASVAPTGAPRAADPSAPVVSRALFSFVYFVNVHVYVCVLWFYCILLLWLCF